MKSSSSRLDHTLLRHHRSLDSLNTETRFRSNFSPVRHNHPFIADSKAFVGTKGGMDANSRSQNAQRNQLETFTRDLPKVISNSAEELRMNGDSLVKDNERRGNLFGILHRLIVSVNMTVMLKKSMHHETFTKVFNDNFRLCLPPLKSLHSRAKDLKFELD